jgi:phosphoglycolate phosphatase
MPVPPAAHLMQFVGPPLQDSFAELLDTDQASLVEEAIGLYRERYARVGLYENAVYPGVIDGLARLRELGHQLWVVTSKPTVYARRIVSHFQLADFFGGVYGSELSGLNVDKTQLIRHALIAADIGVPRPWMVGDRRHDITAARDNGLHAVGVLWGYGTRAELEAAGADHLVATMGDLCEILTTI